MAVIAAGPAYAQKNSGPLLTPPSAGYAPPEAGSAGTGLSQDAPHRTQPGLNRPAVRPAYPTTVGPARPFRPMPGPGGMNPDVERLAETLPLDPQTLALRDREPTDPREIERRLGLREPTGSATDLRGRTPTVREIIDALRPR